MKYEVSCEDAFGMIEELVITQTFGIKNIDNTWNKGEYGLAILKIAITVENILLYHVLNALSQNRPNSVRKKLREEMEEGWTLGRYIHWCSQLEIFKEEDEIKILKILKNERNNIAHKRGYIERNDSITLSKWEEILENTKEFVKKHGTNVKVVEVSSGGSSKI
jgi:hypothetical protein